MSVPLALEYEAVLTRHADELGLDPGDAIALVDYLCSVGICLDLHFLWRPTLGDPGDELVVEVAAAGGCRAIVTHNVRDFAGVERLGIEVLRPGQFLRHMEGS